MGSRQAQVEPCYVNRTHSSDSEHLWPFKKAMMVLELFV